MAGQPKFAKLWTADIVFLVPSRFVLSLVFTISFFLLMLRPYANAAQVTLSREDLNNDSAEVGGYNLYYWQDGQTPAAITVSDTLTYTLTELTTDTTNHSATTVHGSNGDRESGFSNEITYTIPLDASAVNASFNVMPISAPAPLMVIFTDTSSGTITSGLGRVNHAINPN